MGAPGKKKRTEVATPTREMDIQFMLFKNHTAAVFEQHYYSSLLNLGDQDSGTQIQRGGNVVRFYSCPS